jgi:replicative DNA helicase
MIFSLELEKQLLAGLIKYPHKYSDISTLTSSEDFYSKDTIVHKTIYNTLSQAIEQGEEINETMLAHRVTSLGISFEDNITVGDYISSLALQKLLQTLCTKWTHQNHLTKLLQKPISYITDK